jgi:signal transduction histidine kinase
VIADDGRGFEVAKSSHNSLGMGIMRERAAKIGARLWIESRLGAGTTITVVWHAAAPHGATTAGIAK